MFVLSVVSNAKNGASPGDFDKIFRSVYFVMDYLLVGTLGLWGFFRAQNIALSGPEVRSRMTEISTEQFRRMLAVSPVSVKRRVFPPAGHTLPLSREAQGPSHGQFRAQVKIDGVCCRMYVRCSEYPPFVVAEVDSGTALSVTTSAPQDLARATKICGTS